MKTKILTGKNRILLALAIALCVAFAAAETASAEDGLIDLTECDGDYTEFAIEATEMSEDPAGDEVSEDPAGNEVSEDPMKRRLLIVGEDQLDLSGLPGSYEAVSSGDGLFVVQFDTIANATDAYNILKKDESVQSVEFDSVVVGETSVGGSAAAATSIREHLSWGAGAIGVDEYSDSLDQTMDSITVAVVDTGVDFDHPFLSSRLTQGYNFIKGNDVPEDDQGHGTHVSGIIADCARNASAVRIMPIKVLDSEGEGTSCDVVAGMLYACDNGASVINLSLGGEHEDFFDDAVTRVIDSGVAVVASSGNDGKRISKSTCCPAHIEDVISVGSINSRFKVSYFSNYGAELDLVAPGEDINSAFPDDSYRPLQGTSMAAPHVSACVALMELRYGHMTIDQINSVLKRACDPAQPIERSGNGVIDMKNLTGPISEQTISISTEKYVYSGACKNPTINVSHNGEALFKDTDYTVSYLNNRNVGTAKAVVSGKGTYSGSKTFTYTIAPRGTSLAKLTSKKKAITVKWHGQKTQTTGYQIQYTAKSSFESAKTIRIKNNRTVKKTIKGLKKNKKYRVRVRTYKNVGGKNYYSDWSPIRKIRTR